MASQKSISLLEKMGERYNLSAKNLYEVITKSVFRQNDGTTPSEQEVAHILTIANRYNLDPFCKEIRAGRDPLGNIVPIVGVDGWTKLVLNHPKHAGYQFAESEERITMPGAIVDAPKWMSVTFYVTGTVVPLTIKEQLAEVYRYTPGFPTAWQTHTERRLRQTTFIQGARMAYGLSGIYDPEEAANIIEGNEKKDVSHSAKEAAQTQEAPTVDAHETLSDERKTRAKQFISSIIDKARQNGSWSAAKQWVRSQPSLKNKPDILAYVLSELEKAQEATTFEALESTVPDFTDTAGDSATASESTDTVKSGEPEPKTAQRAPAKSRQKTAGNQ